MNIKSMIKNRLLIYDVLRIVGIAIIIIGHIANYSFVGLQIGTFYNEAGGGLGASVLFLVSGAVLMYSYKNKNILSWKDYTKFMLNRAKRLYPAYWMVFIISILLTPTFLSQLTSIDIVWELSGFNLYRGQWGGIVLTVGWFIGAIMALYMIFPVLKISMEKHPYVTLIICLLIWAMSRQYLIINNYGFPAAERSLLPGVLGEFIIGMFLVHMSIGTNLTHTNKIITILSESSFYAFLVHWPIRNMYQNNPIYFVISLIVLCGLVVFLDKRIQSSIH